MADSKITDLTEKATGAATDEFVINDVAGGNADKKLGMDGIRITESQITDLGSYITASSTDTLTNKSIDASQLTGEIADARLSSNVPLLDSVNTYTDDQNFQKDGSQLITDFIQANGAATNSPIFRIRSSRGTIASPTARSSGDSIGSFQFQGYGTSFGTGVQFLGRTTQNWTGSAHGAKFELYTTPNDSTTSTLRFEVDQDGSFDFNSGTINNFVFASTQLSDTSNIARLDANQAFSGSNIFLQGVTIGGTITQSALPGLSLDATASTADTNTSKEFVKLAHTTSGDMLDGFGLHISFYIDDLVSSEAEIARIGAVRDGADNNGELVFHTAASGTLSDRLNISSAGHFNLNSGYVDMTEQTTPGNPAANVGRIYVADSAGTTTLFFRDNAGTETNLLSGGSADNLGNHTATQALDLDGYDLTLDTDGDSAIVNDRDAGVADDEFDIKLGGTVEYTVNGTAFDAVSGAKFRENGTNISPIGVHDIWVGAAGMWPTATSGCAELARTELATNDVNIQTLDFDTTSAENAQFTISLPRNYDNGTITVTPYWTAASGSGTVKWDIKAVAISNDDALDVAFGTLQGSTDTLITANDLHIGPVTSAITIGGTPADADIIQFNIARDVATDTLGVDAKLIGVVVHITTDAAVAA